MMGGCFCLLVHTCAQARAPGYTSYVGAPVQWGSYWDSEGIWCRYPWRDASGYAVAIADTTIGLGGIHRAEA